MEQSNAIRKIDDPSKFAEIVTGLTSTDSLKAGQIQCINLWMKHFSSTDPNILDWVDRNWKAALDYILAKYGDPKYSKSTLRIHLNALASILLAIDKNKYKSVVRDLYLDSSAIQAELEKKYATNLMSDYDLSHFVPYTTIVAKRDKVAEEWKADPENIKLNMKNLILSLNTMIPPLRLNYIGMKFYTSPTEPPTDDTNYLWEYARGSWAIVMNSDKIEGYRQDKGLPHQIMRLSDEIPGITQGNKLNTIINVSLAYAPRDYVLVGLTEKGPMSVSTYNSILSSLFEPKAPTQNLLRISYINHFHRIRIDGMDLPDETLGAIAYRMRHRLETARAEYRKINLHLAPEIETKQSLPSSIQLPVSAKFNSREYSKEYRRKHNAEITRKRDQNYSQNKYDILRYNVIANLNSGNTKHPRKDTIDKYNLVQDPATGKWS